MTYTAGYFDEDVCFIPISAFVLVNTFAVNCKAKAQIGREQTSSFLTSS